MVPQLKKVSSLLMLVIVATFVKVESIGEEQLREIEQYLTTELNTNKLYLNFDVLSKWFEQLQEDPLLKGSRLARNVDHFRDLYLNSDDKKVACSWMYFLSLKDFKHTAKFKYDWTHPDPSFPRTSYLISGIAKKVATTCAEKLKSRHKQKVNSWLFNDSKLKDHIKVIDELIRDVSEVIEQAYGKCDNCRLVERLHEISNDDYSSQVAILYQGLFYLAKKKGITIGEWTAEEAQLNREEMKRLSYQYHAHPCYVFTRYHNKYIQPMVDYAYILGRPDQLDMPRFYTDLDRFEFCELFLY